MCVVEAFIISHIIFFVLVSVSLAAGDVKLSLSEMSRAQQTRENCKTQWVRVECVRFR